MMDSAKSPGRSRQLRCQDEAHPSSSHNTFRKDDSSSAYRSHVADGRSESLYIHDQPYSGSRVTTRVDGRETDLSLDLTDRTATKHAAGAFRVRLAVTAQIRRNQASYV